MENKLKDSSKKFYVACLAKLLIKEKEGWTGWDNPKNKDGFESKIELHLQGTRTQDVLVDVANYCNFLWNLIEAKKGGNPK